MLSSKIAVKNVKYHKYVKNYKYNKIHIMLLNFFDLASLFFFTKNAKKKLNSSG